MENNSHYNCEFVKLVCVDHFKICIFVFGTKGFIIARIKIMHNYVLFVFIIYKYVGYLLSKLNHVYPPMYILHRCTVSVKTICLFPFCLTPNDGGNGENNCDLILARSFVGSYGNKAAKLCPRL
jgi:hypothetical protein